MTPPILQQPLVLQHHLVQRGEHRFAHAGAHPPEHRATIGEKHAQRAAKGDAGGQRGTFLVAVLVSENQIIDAGDEAGIDRRPAGTVLHQPFPVVDMVDRIQSVLLEEHAVAEQAHGDRHDDVDDLGFPAKLLVDGNEVPQLLARLGRNRFEKLDRGVGDLRRKFSWRSTLSRIETACSNPAAVVSVPVRRNCAIRSTRTPGERVASNEKSSSIASSMLERWSGLGSPGFRPVGETDDAEHQRLQQVEAAQQVVASVNGFVSSSSGSPGRPSQAAGTRSTQSNLCGIAAGDSDVGLGKERFLD